MTEETKDTMQLLESLLLKESVANWRFDRSGENIESIFFADKDGHFHLRITNKSVYEGGDGIGYSPWSNNYTIEAKLGNGHKITFRVDDIVNKDYFSRLYEMKRDAILEAQRKAQRISDDAEYDKLGKSIEKYI